MLPLSGSVAKKQTKTQPGMEWSDALEAWCISDPELIEVAFKSLDFVSVDYSGEYRKLAARGLAFPATIECLEHMPLANEGERHAQLRKEFAHLMSRQISSSRLRDVLRAEVKLRVAEVLVPGTTADLIPQMLRPLCDKAFGEMLGGTVSPDDGAPSASQVFDRTLGLNRRLLIEQKIAQLSTAASACPHHGSSVDLRVPLSIVGYDSLLGSLGASLFHVLSRADEVSLDQLSFPADLPETGVPYVERITARDYQLGEVLLPGGSRVRLLLCTADEHMRTTELFFFGGGRHLCLGKALSEFLWRCLAEELVRLTVKVKIERAQRRPRDYVFNFYESIGVSVHA